MNWLSKLQSKCKRLLNDTFGSVMISFTLGKRELESLNVTDKSDLSNEIRCVLKSTSSVNEALINGINYKRIPVKDRGPKTTIKVRLYGKDKENYYKIKRNTKCYNAMLVKLLLSELQECDNK